MSQKLCITIADSVFDRISTLMVVQRKTNRSEVMEELLRTGLEKEEKKENL